MDQLISFITKNIGIVIIVVGVIYTLFFRKSPLERPPNRMPDFGGSGQQRPSQGPAPQRSAPSPAPRQQSARLETRQADPKPTQQRPMALAYSGMDEAATSEVQARQQLPVSQTRMGYRQPAAGTERHGAAALTRDDLSRAVMWAEILGPPRARRPHRR